MANHRIHGKWNTSEYRSWQQMIQRCYNPKRPQYKYWGGRGITVCDRWRKSFQAFLEDMGPRPKGALLDRYPNNDGNYEPGNCRWATQSEQNSNRRRPAKGGKANGKPNSSRYKGVSRGPTNRTNPWRARLTIAGKEKHIGSFATEEEAFEAVKKACAEHQIPLVAS